MNYKTLTATLLLSCLPLLSQPLLAADKPDAKPATTVTAAKESGKVNLNTASINELTALKGIGEKRPRPSSITARSRASSLPWISWPM